MKKIFVLNGSRRKKGNTAKFISTITNKLEGFNIEVAHPQDFYIKPCVGCHKCFYQVQCVQKDELSLLEERILNSDLFILASPVYLHYMTGELKMILDKLSWWAHTLRLQGKPVVLLSTCSSNGHETVIKPLGEIMNFMGGNVIATANASMMFNHLGNEKWLKEVSEEVVRRINKIIIEPPQSNHFIETVFNNTKRMMQSQAILLKKNDVDVEYGELDYWINSGMLNFETFSDYLDSRL